MQHMKNKNGFTIIELIMVMIIIGVLAAVAIPRFQDIVIESEVAVEQRIIQTISDGLELMPEKNMFQMAFARGQKIHL